ncbi:MAG TPA: tail fiber protein [Dyella sp.]|uniref:phage tail protein n=1 Tax=Dyella sp. TaxID=1869338 RepID=UPI002F9451EC
MSEPYLGEIQIFGFKFAPYQWAMCYGQLMPISQNTALFSLLGTTYGGDGKTTFSLPNLQGQAACAVGQGLGLSLYELGENFGSESVTLFSNEMPAHTHTANVFAQSSDSLRFGSPQPNYAPCVPANIIPFTEAKTGNGTFPATILGPGGGSQPHANQQPYLAMNFCIALQGVFPQRP